MDVKSHIIGNKYRLIKKIGSGKFGQVYQGTHIKKNQLVAIKMEKIEQEINTIKYETTILNYLYRKGCRDTPFVLWYGIYNELICLVMTYFEKSFMDYIPKLKCQTQRINKIMVRMIEILENIHGHYVIHRDLKPENFMILENEIYLLDFGLATIYINEKNQHNEFRNDRLLITGTPKYISINIHNGIEPSRRDDMISLGYIYLYFLKGSLPWQGLKKQKDVDHIELIGEVKLSTSVKNLCKGIPECFNNFIEYVRNLSFEERPDYKYLKNLLINCSRDNNVNMEYEF